MCWNNQERIMDVACFGKTPLLGFFLPLPTPKKSSSSSAELGVGGVSQWLCTKGSCPEDDDECGGRGQEVLAPIWESGVPPCTIPMGGLTLLLPPLSPPPTEEWSPPRGDGGGYWCGGLWGWWYCWLRKTGPLLLLLVVVLLLLLWRCIFIGGETEFISPFEENEEWCGLLLLLLRLAPPPP